MTKLKILNFLGYDKCRDSFFALMDDEIADKLRAADIKRLNRRFGTNNDQEDA